MNEVMHKLPSLPDGYNELNDLLIKKIKQLELTDEMPIERGKGF